MLTTVSGSSRAQDSLFTPPPPPTRHILGLAYARVQPFYRTYDVNVLIADSTIRIGRREIVLGEAVLPDSSSGWLLTERRDGLVPGLDSVLLAPDLRPVRWSSRTGGARLDASFDSDSVRGSSRGPRGGVAAIAEACPPDLVVSGAMLEFLLGLVTLSAGWSDSVHVLSSDMTGADVAGAELLVMGEDSIAVVSGPAQHVWLVGLNEDARRLVLWVDKQTGAIARSQQSVAPHTGTLLEFRERQIASFALPPE